MGRAGSKIAKGRTHWHSAAAPVLLRVVTQFIARTTFFGRTFFIANRNNRFMSQSTSLVQWRHSVFGGGGEEGAAGEGGIYSLSIQA